MSVSWADESNEKKNSEIQALEDEIENLNEYLI
jgi:hypothetical protein